MTEYQHPITPPPELVEQWTNQWHKAPVRHVELEDFVATQAARWGADAELEACFELLDINGCPSKWIDMLRDARRPKPPSLAEQALEAQQRVWNGCSTHADWELIGTALERLQELEKGNG